MMHPVVRFYVARYKNGKTTIPKKYEEEVMKYIKWEEEQNTENQTPN